MKEATTTFIGDETREEGYRYNWWTARTAINDGEVRIYQARGNGGQRIFVIPSFNAVVVFTGGNFDPVDDPPSPLSHPDECNSTGNEVIKKKVEKSRNNLFRH